MKTENNREKKLEIMRDLVTNLSNRKSRFDDACPDICEPEEQREIFKEVAVMDNEIDQNINDARKIFSPRLDDMQNSVICFLLYIFGGCFTERLPRKVTSKDLELICRRKPKHLDEVLDSLEHGELHVHVETNEMRRADGWEYHLRSVSMLKSYLL